MTFWLVWVNGPGYMEPKEEWFHSEQAAIDSYNESGHASVPKKITISDPQRIEEVEMRIAAREMTKEYSRTMYDLWDSLDPEDMILT